MLYAQANTLISGNDQLKLSLSGASKKLGITRVTLYGWLANDLLLVAISERVENRRATWFEPEYIEAVRKILPKPPRKRGQSILTPELEDKLRKFNKSWKIQKGEL